MATFYVNGRSVTAEKNQSLLRFLRDELHLTSVKDGCSEGGCGACTVACMSGAMDLRGFEAKQIIAEVDAICK